MEIVKLGKLDLPNAFNSMFKYLSQLDFDYVMFFEDDFCIPESIDILELLEMSKLNNFDQLSLPRQTYYPDEQEYETLLDFLSTKFKFIQKGDGKLNWIEHEFWWTNNPSLINKRVFNVEYPTEFDRCEYMFFNRLKERYRDLKLAYYGKLDDKPKVIHYPLKWGD